MFAPLALRPLEPSLQPFTTTVKNQAGTFEQVWGKVGRRRCSNRCAAVRNIRNQASTSKQVSEGV